MLIMTIGWSWALCFFCFHKQAPTMAQMAMAAMRSDKTTPPTPVPIMTPREEEAVVSSRKRQHQECWSIRREGKREGGCLPVSVSSSPVVSLPVVASLSVNTSLPISLPTGVSLLVVD